CLWPPPIWRVVMRPKLLRPPDLVLPSVNSLMGPPFHRWLRSTCTNWRRLGVVGRNVFSAIAASPSQPGRHIDGMTLFEGHDRALGVAQQRSNILERFLLALAHVGIDRPYLHIEQPLHR